ncbi:hypothetical protein BJ165DRAFT_1401900 [Panaeolus papilionaceus]|nr:hypothetical protein BJ165DRAFT_1401900 [Panaeolus papilionaceus]
MATILTSPHAPYLTPSFSETSISVEQQEVTVVSGAVSDNLTSSLSAPDVKDALLSQVLGNIASSWGSNPLARNFVKHIATRHHPSIRQDKRGTFSRKSPFKLAFQALKSQLEDYHRTTGLIIEENTHLKQQNDTLQKNLAAVQLRVQELESCLAVASSQHQHELDLSRTDKDRIRLLNDHITQLQQFNQSLVSLGFKDNPVIDHAMTGVSNGVASDDALVEAVLEAASQPDSPWARIYSAVLKSRTSPGLKHSRKHGSSSSSDADTASTTSSRAYRHDAPPVLNNILADFKAGLFFPITRVNNAPALLHFGSSSGHTPIGNQRVLWADPPPHQVEDAPPHGSNPHHAVPVPTEDQSIYDFKQQLEDAPIKLNHDHVENTLRISTSGDNKNRQPIPRQYNNYISSSLKPITTSCVQSQDRIICQIFAHKPSSKYGNYPLIKFIIYRINLAADVFGIRSSVDTPPSTSGGGENSPIKSESLAVSSHAQRTVPTGLKSKALSTKPLIVSPLKNNNDAKESQLPPSPSPSSSAVESTTSNASPQTSPSSANSSSPKFRKRIFCSKTSKKNSPPSPATLPNPKLGSSTTGSLGATVSSSLLRKRFGSSGDTKVPRLKLHSEKLSPPPCSPGTQCSSEENSAEATYQRKLDLAPLSSASSTFGMRTRKISQITANFMSSVESMIHSSKSSSSSLSPPISPQVAPSTSITNGSSVLSSPMSSVVSSPSPSPQVPSSSTFLMSPTSLVCMDMEMSTTNPTAYASPPSRPLPALPTSLAHGSNSSPFSSQPVTVAVSPSPLPHHSYISRHPDIDVPAALNAMTFPIKWERYEPKPLYAGPPVSEENAVVESSSLLDEHVPTPAVVCGKGDKAQYIIHDLEVVSPFKALGHSNTLHPPYSTPSHAQTSTLSKYKPTRPPLAQIDTNTFAGNAASPSPSSGHAYFFRSSYPPSLSKLPRKSHEPADSAQSDFTNQAAPMAANVDSDDGASKSDSSLPVRKLNVKKPSARELGKRRGIFLVEKVDMLIGLSVSTESSSSLSTSPIADIPDNPVVERKPAPQESKKIDYRSPSTLIGLDISPENINNTVGRLVSSFSSSSLGSLDDSSESDCETLRERAREHLEDAPRDICKLEHIQRALAKEELYRGEKGQDHAPAEVNKESEKGEGGDLTLLCPPPLGLVDLSPPSSPSAKVVTWGGISVQNISSSETSSLASSSSFGSVASAASDCAVRKKSSKSKRSDQPSTPQRSLSKPEQSLGASFVERAKKPPSATVISCATPTSILKKSAIPTKSASRSAVTNTKGMRPTVKKLASSCTYPLPSALSPPAVNPTVSKTSVVAHLSRSSASQLAPEPFMCENSPPISEFSSNSGFVSVASVDSVGMPDFSATTSGRSGNVAVSGKNLDVILTTNGPEAVHPPPPLSAVASFGGAPIGPVQSDVISRSTVGPTAKRLSSGSLMPKRSRLPAVSLSPVRPPSPPTTPSAFQTKRSFAPGRLCPDTSRSFLAVPSRKTRSKTVSSPLPPALCTPRPESLLSLSPGKTRSNTVPYSPTTRSPLSQHVITAPSSVNKLACTPRSSLGVASDRQSRSDIKQAHHLLVNLLGSLVMMLNHKGG